MMDLVKELTMNKIGNIGQKGNLGSFCQKINLGILGRKWNFGNLGRKVNVGVYRPETETLASVGQKKNIGIFKPEHIGTFILEQGAKKRKLFRAEKKNVSEKSEKKNPEKLVRVPIAGWFFCFWFF